MKSEANPNVYVAQVGDLKFFIVVYVDDLILVCNDQNKLLQIKEELSQKFYMEQPKGFIQEGEHLVCKLHKSLYGLKQSPKAWNQILDAFLKNIMFVRSDVDFSVYVAQVEDVKFFIVVYVDDFILVCNNKDKLLQFKLRFGGLTPQDLVRYYDADWASDLEDKRST